MCILKFRTLYKYAALHVPLLVSLCVNVSIYIQLNNNVSSQAVVIPSTFALFIVGIRNDVYVTGVISPGMYAVVLIMLKVTDSEVVCGNMIFIRSMGSVVKLKAASLEMLYS